MKRVINLLLLCLFCTVVQAQDINLTVDITPGGLKDAMNYRQRQRVTNLILTGSMNDADFYLIRDSMPKLLKLDMKYIEVDTIPKKAFYKSILRECILPIQVKYIGEQAFCDNIWNSVIITGAFPKLGAKVFFGDSKGVNVGVSEDNKFCKYVNYGIYSKDGKSLFYRNHYLTDVEEGTEVVESRAFDGAHIMKIILPSTLKLIREYAFCNIFPLIPNTKMYDYDAIFFSEAVIPPTLEKNALYDDDALSQFMLCVPEESVEAYKQSDSQWMKFRSISTGIKNDNCPSFFIAKEGDGITIKSEKIITQVEVSTLSGKCVYKDVVNNVSFHITIQSFNNVYILKASYEKGKIYSYKFIK